MISYGEPLARELELLSEKTHRNSDANILLGFAHTIRKFPNGSFTEKQERFIEALIKRCNEPFEEKILSEDDRSFVQAFIKYWNSTSPYYRSRFPGRCRMIDRINESISCNQNIEVKDWNFLLEINKTFFKMWNLLNDELSSGKLVKVKLDSGLKIGLSLGERRYDNHISYKILVDEEIKWIPVGKIRFGSIR